MLRRCYRDRTVDVWLGDCLDVLPLLDAGSVDAVVTDPPYDLTANKRGGSGVASINLDSPYGRARIGTGSGAGGFMGKDWDATGVAFDPDTWRAVARVLKPGGHLLAFGGTRTFHRLACGVEDAGFEIRDSIAWLYGSGFPKSLNLTDVDGERTGWGTALKPAFEPIIVARKPLHGTVAANVQAHGTGALNIDACRIGDGDDVVTFDRAPRMSPGNTYDLGTVTAVKPSGAGRWPANVVLDETQAAALDQMSGDTIGTVARAVGSRSGGIWQASTGQPAGPQYADSGGASRFYYTAKADSAERVRIDGIAHPTVKPLDLMRWLVRLVTPPNGLVLDPFAGSGTTVEACVREGFKCTAIEREPDYLPLIVGRIHRRRDPVAYIARSGADEGLFALLEGNDDE